MKALLIVTFLALVFSLAHSIAPLGDLLPQGQHARALPYIVGSGLYTIGLIWILIVD